MGAHGGLFRVGARGAFRHRLAAYPLVAVISVEARRDLPLHGTIEASPDTLGPLRFSELGHLAGVDPVVRRGGLASPALGAATPVGVGGASRVYATIGVRFPFPRCSRAG